MTMRRSFYLLGLGCALCALPGCAFNSDEGTPAGANAGSGGTAVGAAGTGASSGDAGTGGMAGNAGTSGSAGDAGSTGGAGASSDAGTAATMPWGPSFFILAQDDKGGDVALGVMWEPSAVTFGYADGPCIGFATSPGAVVGTDVGSITATGGSLVPSQPLSRNAEGYYAVSGVQAWRPSDELSLSYGSTSLGPLAIPTAMKSDLKTTTSVTRSAPLTIAFEGSNASHVILTFAGANSERNYVLACIFDNANGTASVPVAALASFPEGITDVDVNLRPVNREQGADVLFVVAGPGVTANVPLGS